MDFGAAAPVNINTAKGIPVASEAKPIGRSWRNIQRECIFDLNPDILEDKP